MDRLRGLLDFAYGAKAWVATAIGIVADIVILIQVVAADEAITFEEAEGVRLAITAGIANLLTLLGTFAVKNKPSPS